MTTFRVELEIEVKPDGNEDARVDVLVARMLEIAKFNRLATITVRDITREDT